MGDIYNHLFHEVPLDFFNIWNLKFSFNDGQYEQLLFVLVLFVFCLSIINCYGKEYLF